MYPELFTVFGFPIRSFGVMAAIGLLLAFWLMNHRAKKAGEDPQKLSDILFFTMLGALVGARLFYVVRYWDKEFSGNFMKVFKINEGGIVFQGGFIGGLIVAWFLCRKKNVDFIKSLDIVAPCLALGHAMGRIGCYLNGCCFGGRCSSDIGVTFPKGSLPYQDHINKYQIDPAIFSHSYPVYPTQLYSFAANLFICILLISVTAKLKIKGHLFSLYLIVYGIWRISVEFLRDDQTRHLGLSAAQYIAIGQIVAGIAMMVYFKKISKKEYPLDDGEIESSN